MPTDFSFDATDKPIQELLFSTQLKFQIPRYQRPYTWKEDEVSEFWNDISNSVSTFFLGSFILNHENYPETGYVEIIDGQQRILTVTILAAVLRDIAKTIDPDVAGRFHRQDIAVEQRDGKNVYRVLCGDTLKDFFEENIQVYDNDIQNNPKISSPEEKKVVLNYQFFHEKISKEIEKYENKQDKIKSLEKIRERLSKTVVIHIKIESDEAAYEIFETTNARGVDLSVADLVKNLILKNIREKDDRDAAKDLWIEIVDNIQSVNSEMKRFIRYYWISKHKFVYDKQLYRAIKREITDWDQFLSDIGSASEWYKIMAQAVEADWVDIKDGLELAKSLRAIKIMNVTQCYVLFLSILRHIDKLGRHPKRIFHMIETFQFVYSAVCSLPANRLERLYSGFAIELEKVVEESTNKKLAGNIDRLFSNLESELRDLKPPFDLFYENFIEISYSGHESKRMFIKYIFDRINSWYSETNENIINFSSVNIEHILPQKPSKWGFKKSDVKKYVNLLGNLTLLDEGINSSIGNEKIDLKLPELAKSKLPITQILVEEISEKKSWDEDAIRRRHEMLANEAYYKIWVF